MTNWIEAAKETLLPLSVATEIYAALKEWQHNGAVIDHSDHEAVCDLCGQQELRWHFGIENKLNGNEMMVGSLCILRFSEIDVIDPDTGLVVLGDDRRLVLNRERDRMIRQAKREKWDRMVKEAERQRWEAERPEREKRERDRLVREAAEKEQRQAAQAQREATLHRLRQLWKRATKARSFIERVAVAYRDGGRITPGQVEAINRMLDKFKV